MHTDIRGVAISLLLAVAGAATSPGAVAAQERQVVEMVAERFTFTPSRIEIPVGTTVEIHIRSQDTNHGFHLVNGPNVIVPKRRQGEAVVLFEAEVAGVYEFECSKLCGAGHNFMKGEIVVTEEAAEDDES
jgi:cytochrome c oxidase subunit 2